MGKILFLWLPSEILLFVSTNTNGQFQSQYVNSPTERGALSAYRRKCN